MNRKKIIMNEEKKIQSRWQNYRRIWITKWNIICVKIVAIVSFSCIITVILIRSINESSDNESELFTSTNLALREKEYMLYDMTYNIENTKRNDCTHSYCSYWGTTQCCFHCYQMHSTLITSIINKKYLEHNCKSSIQLTLEEIQFEEHVMKKEWWDIKLFIKYLFIINNDLIDIEEGALNQYFTYTVTITFSKTQIPYYRKNMFTDIIYLKDFSIQDSDLAKEPNAFSNADSEGIKFEYGILEHFKNSLSTLQVQRSIKNPQAIQNLTGIELNALQIIDFRFNENLTYIPDNSFNAKILQQVHISNNALTDININAFKNAPKVSIIFLQNNNLKTLNKNIFSSFDTHDNISISYNKWNCNCELKFLNIFKHITDFDSTTCIDGTPLQKIFKTCTDGLETTSLITTPEEFTTPNNSGTSVIQSKRCKVISNQFRIIENDNNVMISYDGDTESDDKFIFLTSDRTSCKFDNGIGYISGSNTSYIMCKQTYNELDCISGRSQNEYDEQTWLKNNEKIPTILIGAVVTVITSILSGISVFYYVKKCSKFMRSNKRKKYNKSIENNIPNKPQSPIYLMPVSHEAPLYREVSYLPVRHAPYLTPISQRYMKIKDNYDRPVLKRSLSDESMKTVASYVTENQLMFSSRIDHHIVDHPPPLPPPRVRYEEISTRQNQSPYF